jgi:DNA polymerase-3 subunit epsilon
VDFIAFDVETANADVSSICQIGLVPYKSGQRGESWQTLINPEDYFDVINVGIHGIDEEMVKNAPTFPEVFDALRDYLRGRVVAHHMPFDRLAINRVTEKYALEGVECTWLDTAKVARRAWPEFAEKGYGLANVADRLGITFRHHNAEEDARAAGELLLRAITHTGLSLQDWLQRVGQPIRPSLPPKRAGPSKARQISREPNPDGPLCGEVLLFTGTLSIGRAEAADLAAFAGCEVVNHVSTRITLLVVGEQDIRKLKGHQKSSKHRRVEELIAKGHQIRILGESDFRRLVELESAL